MKKLLTNIFREAKHYTITWKSKQKKSDWLAYLFFWIGFVGGLCLLKLLNLSSPWYAWIFLSLIIGSVLEGIYMLIYSIIYVFFFHKN